jgi:CMP-N-acetylneuraminic acid synthetase
MVIKMIDRKVTAVVPMKAQSERVQGKNTRDFCKKPLFWQILNTLHETDCVSEIVVDTDDDTIEDMVSRYFSDVKILRRPAELMGHAVSMNKILEYDLSQLDREHFLQTHSTNPLLTAKTIDMAVFAYFEQLGECDSLFSVSRIQARCFLRDRTPVNHNPNELIQTQFLNPVLVENSNIYIFSKFSFAKTGRRIGKVPYMFEMNEYEAIDIDEEKDFKIAEIICAARKEKINEK